MGLKVMLAHRLSKMALPVISLCHYVEALLLIRKYRTAVVYITKKEDQLNIITGIFGVSLAQRFVLWELNDEILRSIPYKTNLGSELF